MNDVTIVALAKIFKDKAEDIQLAAGVYPLDEHIVLDVAGVLKKANSHQYTPTVKIPLLMTMALLLEKAGFMRDRAIELLIDSMQEALALGEKADEIVAERLKDIDTAWERVREVTEALPKETRQGATTVNALLNIVEEPELVS